MLKLPIRCASAWLQFGCSRRHSPSRYQRS
jgi:hypothetical protein